MKNFRLLTVLLFVTVSLMVSSCSPKPSMVGVYISKAPTPLEQLKMGYINRNWRFLYVREGESVLKLEKDSAFSYQQTFCKKGEVISAGKWHVADDKLVLHFTNGQDKEDLKFEILEKQLVLVQSTIITKTSKPINSLTLLQRQK